MVVEEQEDERSLLSGECDGYNGEELGAVLEEFREVFSEVPGNTDRVIMKMILGTVCLLGRPRILCRWEFVRT